MATGITKLGVLMRKRRVDEALACVRDYHLITSTEVSHTADNNVLKGTVLHISKTKKVAYSKTVPLGDKKIRRETSAAYLRLVFCREAGESGSVFAVLFRQEDRQKLSVSDVHVGGGLTIVKPQLEGEFAGMALVWTPEPCLPAVPNLREYFPIPFSLTGFTCFCAKRTKLKVVTVGVASTCPGRMCAGLYGKDGKCPCLSTSSLSRAVITIRFAVEHIMSGGDWVEMTSDFTAGLQLEQYMNRGLSDQLVDSNVLEAAVKGNDDVLMDILGFVEEEVNDGWWGVMGWVKGSGIGGDDGRLTSTKCHVVSLTKERGIKKYRYDSSSSPERNTVPPVRTTHHQAGVVDDDSNTRDQSNVPNDDAMSSQADQP